VRFNIDARQQCCLLKSYYPCQKKDTHRVSFFVLYEVTGLELTKVCGFPRVRAEALRKQFGELFLAKDCKVRKHFGNQVKRRAFQQ